MCSLLLFCSCVVTVNSRSIQLAWRCGTAELVFSTTISLSLVNESVGVCSLRSVLKTGCTSLSRNVTACRGFISWLIRIMGLEL